MTNVAYEQLFERNTTFKKLLVTGFAKNTQPALEGTLAKQVFYNSKKSHVVSSPGRRRTS